MTIPTAIAELTAAFDVGFADIGGIPRPDRRSVVTSWPSVPVEAIRAAGLEPVFARGGAASTPLADGHLEADIFPSRLRHLVEAALTGRLAPAARIVIPRTSEADYKCFLYLRQFVRTDTARGLPPVALFDLLQSSGPHVRQYDVARTQALIDGLASASGHRATVDDLHREIARANAARAVARRLVELRREPARVTGTEVLPLLGAFWLMAPDRYATLANEAASVIARRTPLGGPRVLLAGAPVDTRALTSAIESHGAVVVCELSPWGSGVAGDDVADDQEPVAALADKYRTDTIGARMPADAMRSRVEAALGGVDAVVVSLPPEDTVFGWDYPDLRDRLDARGIPHACLRTDPHQPLTPAAHARLASLVAAAAPVREARHR